MTPHQGQVAVVASLMLILSACASDPADIPIAPESSVDLIGSMPGEWHYVGVLGDTQISDEDAATFPLAYVTEANEVYVGRFDEVTTPPTVDDKAWSNGVDNRVNNPFTSLSPYSTIGVLYPRKCSAVIVDNRVLLTGAHCVFSPTGQLYTGGTFIPGLRGSVEPFGRAVAGTAFLMTDYISMGCVTNPARDACYARDWALVPYFPTANIPSQTGILSITTAPQSEQTNWTVWNAGYPACSLPGVEPAVMYGPPTPCPCPVDEPICNDFQWVDAGCSLGSFSQADADGERRLLRTSCDASPGQSGSPLIRQGHNVVMGVLAGVSLQTSARPTVAVRITPTYYAQMQSVFAALN